MKDLHNKYPNGIDCIIPICDLKFNEYGLITHVMEMELTTEESEIIDKVLYEGFLISYIKSIALKKCNLKILKLIDLAQNNFNKVTNLNNSKRKDKDIIIGFEFKF